MPSHYGGETNSPNSTFQLIFATRVPAATVNYQCINNGSLPFVIVEEIYNAQLCEFEQNSMLIH